LILYHVVTARAAIALGGPGIRSVGTELAPSIEDGREVAAPKA
jgi:hypothetical protein